MRYSFWYDASDLAAATGLDEDTVNKSLLMLDKGSLIYTDDGNRYRKGKKAASRQRELL